MTYQDEELLISRPPASQQRRSPDRDGPGSRVSSSAPFVRIECQAEERHFVDSTPCRTNSPLKTIGFSTSEQIRPGRFRSEIVVHNNPNIDLYIKRLRVAFHDHPDSSSMHPSPVARSTSSPRNRSSPTSTGAQQQREQSGKGKDSKRKFRSMSLPRSRSQVLLHQWVDDICSNEQLMADDDIVFFLKNGEFLARI